MEYLHQEPPTETQTPELPPKIYDYSGLVPVVQLSVAREQNIPGAMEAQRFSDLISPLDTARQQEIIADVGRDFDGALVNFITAALVKHRRHGIVILAEASEGIDGYLPWEHQLTERVQMLKDNGTFRGTAFARVERFVDPNKENYVPADEYSTAQSTPENGPNDARATATRTLGNKALIAA